MKINWMMLRSALIVMIVLAVSVVQASPTLSASVYFVENQGQWAEEFRFRAGLGQGVAFVTERGLVLDLQKRAEGGGMRDEGQRPFEERPVPRRVQGHVLRLTFLSANLCPEMRGQDKLASYSNYFLGRDSSRWKSRVGHYPRIVADDVWPGIHVEYVLKPEGVELLYHLQAGADPAQIQLQIEGLSASLSLDATGNLVLPTSLGPLTEHAPTAFQANRAIPCRYRLTSDSTYTFTLDSYDPTQALTIDPLLYSTFFGGNDFDDMLNVMICDSASRTLLLGGTTGSNDFPTTPGAYRDSASGSYDLFVSRFAADGHSLIFSTYLGGSAMDWRCFLVLEPHGISGGSWITESRDWPLTTSAPDTIFNGNTEGAFWRLSTDGTELLFSSYWGSGDQDYIEGICRDRDGRIYLAGRTRSNDFITTANALYPTFQGTEPAYISVFESTGSTLLYSTFFPGSQAVYVNGLNVVAPFRVWLSGSTQGGIVITPDALQSTGQGSFLSLLDLASSTVVYSSYFGGAGHVVLMSMLPEDSNHVLLTGYNYSTTFPVTPDAYDTARVGVKTFITRLELPATILHSTLLGSPTAVGESQGSTVPQVDPVTGNLWIGGTTHATDFPCTVNAVDTLYSDPVGEEYGDGYVVCFSHDLDRLVYGSYLGGSSHDGIVGMALESSSRIWLGGYTESVDFPVTSNAYQPQTNGWGDAFLSLLILPEDTSTATPPQTLPPSSFRLSAFPNPFNSTTTLRFTLPAPSEVTLTLYDLQGREVLRRDLGRLRGGEHRRQIAGDGLSSGVYFARINAGPQSAVRKLCLLR